MPLKTSRYRPTVYSNTSRNNMHIMIWEMQYLKRYSQIFFCSVTSLINYELARHHSLCTLPPDIKNMLTYQCREDPGPCTHLGHTYLR